MFCVCYFAEDHCDIVPFIHSFYRAKKVQHDNKVVLIHFDAHPDLSIPSTTTQINTLESWKDTENLYDILSEEGGIAEFILPLCSTGLISQVVWLRSEWCDQLPDGEVSFHVKEVEVDCVATRKNNKMQPHVTYQTAYYLDEGVVCCEDNCTHTTTIA